MRNCAKILASFFLRLLYRVCVCVPNNAIFSFLINFLISVGRTLLPRKPAIAITTIIDFTYREFFKDILFTVIVSLAITFIFWLVILSSYISIHANVTILSLIFSSRTIS